MPVDSPAPGAVLVVDTSCTEIELVARLRASLAGEEYPQSSVDAAVAQQLVAAHHASRSGLGAPAASVFGPNPSPRFDRLKSVAPVPVGLSRGPSVAVLERSVAEVLLASCDPLSSAPAICAVISLLGAHGFQVEIRPHTLTGTNAVLAPRSRAAMAELKQRAKTISQQHKADQTEWAKRFPGFGGQAPAAGSTYAGSQELHSLSKSVRFHRWMAEMLRPAIGPAVGKRVLEVGAGIGTMTRALAETYPDSEIISIEPDPALFGQLVERISATRVLAATQSTLELDPVGAFDTVLYVNVLEHIEDHAGELRRALQLLRHGGHIGIIVPALPGLYGSLDAKTGHYRRYQKAALRDLVEAAGFTVTDLHYFDTVGVAPYWASIKLGSMPALSDRTTMLFDNVLVPLSKLVHRTWKSVPVGKNLLLIAVRP